jgi:hypothetical protein
MYVYIYMFVCVCVCVCVCGNVNDVCPNSLLYPVFNARID